MSYNTLKALVNSKVYENTEQRITGGDMNDVLQSAIASLGAHYQMGGLVSPADQITVGDEPVVFLATTPGTYTYFGGIVVADGEVALLVWSGTAWSKQTPDIATGTEVSQLGQEVQERVKQDGSIESKEEVAIVDEDDNCIAQLKGGHIKTKEFDSRNSATKTYTDNKVLELKAKVSEVNNGDDDDKSFSIVDENDYGIAQFKGGHIKTKEFDSRTIKIKGSKIVNFSEFSGSNWVIAQSKLSAACSTTNSKLLYRNVSYEDEFNLCCSFIPVGETFEVALGKYDTMAGSQFALKYDGLNTTIEVYKMSNGVFVYNSSLNCENVSAESGKKIFIRIEKRTNALDRFSITVSDEYGNVDAFSPFGVLDFHAWGSVFFELLSGTGVTVSDFSFGYPIRQELDLIIIGHSYVEGASINGQQNKRFAALLANDIGADNTLILGHGGEELALFKNYVDEYCKWFANAKYALLYFGANDGLNPTSPSFDDNVTTFKNNMVYVNSVISSKGIIPVWCTVNWLYSTGKPNTDELNEWIISTFPYVVDVRKVFEDENGELDESKYLSDKVHPTVEAHKLLYNVIKAQASYLLNV